MSQLEPVLDTVIRVDRSVRPVYPNWVKTVMNPELEAKGPAEYAISAIVRNLWLHDSQKDGEWVKGEVIYDYLKSNNMLESCIDLRDLEAIKSLGIDFFRKHFAGKAVCGWKSVVQDRDGYRLVPFLIKHDAAAVVRWRWLDDYWYDRSLAARFAS